MIRRGLTLLELMVVVAIIGILASLLLPAVQQSREAARRQQCSSQLRQIGLGLHAHHDAVGQLPASYLRHTAWSWIVQLLPFIDEQSLYDRFDLNQVMFPLPNDSKNLVNTATPLSLLLCPSTPEAAKVLRLNEYHAFAHTNFLGMTGAEGGILDPHFEADGMFPGWQTPVRFRDVTDGLSHVICVGERPQVWFNEDQDSAGWWATDMGFAPKPYGRGGNVLDASRGLFAAIGDEDDVFHWWSHHPYGAHFAFGDNHVRFLPCDLDHRTFIAMATRHGAEVAEQDVP